MSRVEIEINNKKGGVDWKTGIPCTRETSFAVIEENLRNFSPDKVAALPGKVTLRVKEGSKVVEDVQFFNRRLEEIAANAIRPEKAHVNQPYSVVLAQMRKQ